MSCDSTWWRFSDCWPKHHCDSRLFLLAVLFALTLVIRESGGTVCHRLVTQPQCVLLNSCCIIFLSLSKHICLSFPSFFGLFLLSANNPPKNNSQDSEFFSGLVYKIHFALNVFLLPWTFQQNHIICHKSPSQRLTYFACKHPPVEGSRWSSWL